MAAEERLPRLTCRRQRALPLTYVMRHCRSTATNASLTLSSTICRCEVIGLGLVTQLLQATRLLVVRELVSRCV
ncbi:MAG: hypothetical protein MZW92_75330 [Comamonadaceae bacterium]|nr:hypothetical protein [Comamonadaceae bacterium]